MQIIETVSAPLFFGLVFSRVGEKPMQKQRSGWNLENNLEYPDHILGSKENYKYLQAVLSTYRWQVITSRVKYLFWPCVCGSSCKLTPLFLISTYLPCRLPGPNSKTSGPEPAQHAFYRSLMETGYQHPYHSTASFKTDTSIEGIRQGAACKFLGFVRPPYFLMPNLS